MQMERDSALSNGVNSIKIHPVVHEKYPILSDPTPWLKIKDTISAEQTLE